LKLVRGMVQQFNLPIRIVPAETVRAPDGLALSSRNNYLTPASAPRRRTCTGSCAGRRRDRPRRHDYANLEVRRPRRAAQRGWKVDYVAIRHGLGLRIPHPEGYDHPNLMIVLGAAVSGTPA